MGLDPLAGHAQQSQPTSRSSTTSPTAASKPKKKGPDTTGWKRVTIQPNGWGQTKAQAVKDLDRVMKLYEKKPGFRRDNYVAVVYVGRNKWQADGRCTYLAPPTVKPATAESRTARKNRNVTPGGFSRKVR